MKFFNFLQVPKSSRARRIRLAYIDVHINQSNQPTLESFGIVELFSMLQYFPSNLHRVARFEFIAISQCFRSFEGQSSDRVEIKTPKHRDQQVFVFFSCQTDGWCQTNFHLGIEGSRLSSLQDVYTSLICMIR